MKIFATKYKINSPETASPPPGINVPIWTKPQAMPFELLSSGDLTQDVIEKTTSINFRVELDDPLNYISTSGSVEVSAPSNPVILSLLDLNDLQENILTIQITDEDNNTADFIGIVDPAQSYYDKIDQTYHLYFYDLFSYVYNHLSKYLATVEVGGEAIGDGLPYYNELLFGDETQPLDFFLRTYNSLGDGVVTDLDIPFTVSSPRMVALAGLTSINHFLDQVRNYYGAYVLIDGYGIIRFISRNRGEVNAGSVDITDNIIEEDYTEEYTMPAEYNAVRCSARIDDPDGTTIVDHLIYYDGEVKHKFIYYDTDLSSFNYLDLRINLPLGGLEKYYIFPNRTIDELKTIYSNIVTPKNIVKCKVDRIDLPILKRVTISGVEYVIMNMEKYYEEEYSTLELLRK